MNITTTDALIIGRKLSLFRALFVRLGPTWPSRLRKAGIPVSNKELTTSVLWNSHFSAMEKYARNYGFVCPFDDIGATEHLVAKMRELLAEDVAKARYMQDPEKSPTSGGLENHANDPVHLVPLQEAFAAKFGLPALTPSPKVYPAPARHIASEGSLQASDKAVSLLASKGFPVDRADLTRMLGSKLSVGQTAAKMKQNNLKRLKRLKKKDSKDGNGIKK